MRSLSLVLLVLLAGCGNDPDEPECVPRTCEAFGRECGTLADGCGGTLECGSCQAPLECNVRGQCDVACVPATCEELGKDCGRVPDGCGRTIVCGECGPSEICGVFEANACALPPDACSPGAWAGFADGFFERNCRGCHTRFDRIRDVRREFRLRGQIASGLMPQGATLDPAEKQWILDWIDCGMKE